jgi:hypothetical protein
MKKLLFPALFMLFANFSHAQRYELSSPDGKLSAGIEISQSIGVTVSKDGSTVVSLGNILLNTGRPAKES